MPEYGICFDFPEADDPWFAGWTTGDTLGFVLTLRAAARFDTEEAAERTLLNAYGPNVREFGAVVELES